MNVRMSLGYPDGASYIKLDDQLLENVTGVTMVADEHGEPVFQLSLRVSVVELDAPNARVTVPEEMADLLQRMGWTPPTPNTLTSTIVYDNQGRSWNVLNHPRWVK